MSENKLKYRFDDSNYIKDVSSELVINNHIWIAIGDRNEDAVFDYHQEDNNNFSTVLVWDSIFKFKDKKNSKNIINRLKNVIEWISNSDHCSIVIHCPRNSGIDCAVAFYMLKKFLDWVYDHKNIDEETIAEFRKKYEEKFTWLNDFVGLTYLGRYMHQYIEYDMPNKTKEEKEEKVKESKRCAYSLFSVYKAINWLKYNINSEDKEIKKIIGAIKWNERNSSSKLYFQQQNSSTHQFLFFSFLLDMLFKHGITEREELFQYNLKDLLNKKPKITNKFQCEIINEKDGNPSSENFDIKDLLEPCFELLKNFRNRYEKQKWDLFDSYKINIWKNIDFEQFDKDKPLKNEEFERRKENDNVISFDEKNYFRKNKQIAVWNGISINDFDYIWAREYSQANLTLVPSSFRKDDSGITRVTLLADPKNVERVTKNGEDEKEFEGAYGEIETYNSEEIDSETFEDCKNNPYFNKQVSLVPYAEMLENLEQIEEERYYKEHGKYYRNRGEGRHWKTGVLRYMPFYETSDPWFVEPINQDYLKSPGCGSHLSYDTVKDVLLSNATFVWGYELYKFTFKKEKLDKENHEKRNVEKRSSNKDDITNEETIPKPQWSSSCLPITQVRYETYLSVGNNHAEDSKDEKEFILLYVNLHPNITAYDNKLLLAYCMNFLGKSYSEKKENDFLFITSGICVYADYRRVIVLDADRSSDDNNQYKNLFDKKNILEITDKLFQYRNQLSHYISELSDTSKKSSKMIETLYKDVHDLVIEIQNDDSKYYKHMHSNYYTFLKNKFEIDKLKEELISELEISISEVRNKLVRPFNLFTVLAAPLLVSSVLIQIGLLKLPPGLDFSDSNSIIAWLGYIVFLILLFVIFANFYRIKDIFSDYWNRIKKKFSNNNKSEENEINDKKND